MTETTWGLAVLLALAAGDPAPTAPSDYAVVVSKETANRPGWRDVVKSLVKTHRARKVIWAESVTEALPELREQHPRFACFIVTPNEAGRELVVDVHRLTRKLDDDPYGDVQWGILTGYDAEDALRIATHREPLEVRRFGSGSCFSPEAFEEGVAYDESKQGRMLRKAKDGTVEEASCADDATAELVGVLNEYRPDYFMTSGHATSRDWQIGFRFRSGQFRCADGQLFGLDLQGKRHEVHSPNPKVYTACGNCLMGLVDGEQAMALAWMHSAGVHQMMGYVVSTWYGFGGRGDKDYFIAQAGRFTLAESFFLQNQRLLLRLKTEFPEVARVDLDRFDIEKNPNVINDLAREHKITERDALGLLWDRDTVAFYGDPAWEARVVPQRELEWEQALTESDGVYRFEITVRADGRWGAPPMAFLPERVEEIEITSGAELNPLITDDFLLLPLDGERKAGEVLIVEFTANPI